MRYVASILLFFLLFIPLRGICSGPVVSPFEKHPASFLAGNSIDSDSFFNNFSLDDSDDSFVMDDDGDDDDLTETVHLTKYVSTTAPIFAGSEIPGERYSNTCENAALPGRVLLARLQVLRI